jgi:hypothetical protein
MDKFTKNPPKPLGERERERQKERERERGGIALPPVPSSFPQLAQLRPSELGQLLNDDEALRTFIEELPPVKETKTLLRELRASLSLSASPSASLRAASLDVTRLRAASLRREVSALERRASAVSSAFEGVALGERLGERAGEAERESEEIARIFVGGGGGGGG